MPRAPPLSSGVSRPPCCDAKLPRDESHCAPGTCDELSHCDKPVRDDEHSSGDEPSHGGESSHGDAPLSSEELSRSSEPLCSNEPLSGKRPSHAGAPQGGEPSCAASNGEEPYCASGDELQQWTVASAMSDVSEPYCAPGDGHNEPCCATGDGDEPSCDAERSREFAMSSGAEPCAMSSGAEPSTHALSGPSTHASSRCGESSNDDELPRGEQQWTVASAVSDVSHPPCCEAKMARDESRSESATAPLVGDESASGDEPSTHVPSRCDEFSSNAELLRGEQ